jgi:hypothetical protein
MKQKANRLIMTKQSNNRHIPSPPSGGSWTFDDSNWEWVSNDPAPPVEQAPGELGDSNIAVEGA